MIKEQSSVFFFFFINIELWSVIAHSQSAGPGTYWQAPAVYNQEVGSDVQYVILPTVVAGYVAARQLASGQWRVMYCYGIKCCSYPIGYNDTFLVVLQVYVTPSYILTLPSFVLSRSASFKILLTFLGRTPWTWWKYRNVVSLMNSEDYGRTLVSLTAVCVLPGRNSKRTKPSLQVCLFLFLAVCSFWDFLPSMCSSVLCEANEQDAITFQSLLLTGQRLNDVTQKKQFG